MEGKEEKKGKMLQGSKAKTQASGFPVFVLALQEVTQ